MPLSRLRQLYRKAAMYREMASDTIHPKFKAAFLEIAAVCEDHAARTQQSDADMAEERS